jgi:DNA-binding PadR family transcriptional regulator
MSSPRCSTIALAILAMLAEAPMHPYRMQRLIKERGKDEVINVAQRASIYQTIRRLHRDGLLATLQTIREDKRPDRTVYEITDAGREVLLQWLRDLLSKPDKDFPVFPAAISFLPVLTPRDALRQLKLRALAIESELKRTGELLDQAAAVPRLFLLEGEYVRAMQATELAWVRAVIEDLRTGRITWNEAWLRKIAQQFSPDSDSAAE